MTTSDPTPGVKAFPTERMLLVSPHLDDAALSCEALVGGSRRLDVLTVCTARPMPAAAYAWDRACGFIDSDQAMDARLCEDDHAFAGTPHALHRLGLLDRQYLTGDQLRPARDAYRLIEWIDVWLADAGEAGLVILPVGAGHPSHDSPHGLGINLDHVWIRDTVAAHLTRRGLGVGLYEEMPYLFAASGDRSLTKLAGRLGCDSTESRVRIDPLIKARRVGCYPSQLPALRQPGKAPLDHPDGLAAIERYWLLTPARGHRGAAGLPSPHQG